MNDEGATGAWPPRRATLPSHNLAAALHEATQAGITTGRADAQATADEAYEAGHAAGMQLGALAGAICGATLTALLIIATHPLPL